MTIQPGAVLNTAGFGNRGENVEVPVYMNKGPTSSDTNYPIGKRWVDTNAEITYELNGLSTIGGILTAVWAESSTSAGALDTINSLIPVAGNINIVGTSGQIGVANASNTVTLSLPNPLTPPGALTVVGTTNINHTGTAATTIGSGTAGAVTIECNGTLELDVAAGNTIDIGSSLSGSKTVQICTQNAITSQTVGIMTGTNTSGHTFTFNLMSGASVSPGACNISTGAGGHVTTIGAIDGTIAIAAPTALTLASGAGTGIAVDTSAGTGIPISAKSAAATTSAIHVVAGGIDVPVVTVAAAASPQTCNARFGSVSFSSVSIAAGATQALVITNSLITAATQVMKISMYGATTGAALNIQSVVLDGTGHTATITVENGTGATTSVANITFVFWLMN